MKEFSSYYPGISWLRNGKMLPVRPWFVPSFFATLLTMLCCKIPQKEDDNDTTRCLPWTPLKIKTPQQDPPPSSTVVFYLRCVQIKGASESDREEIWTFLGKTGWTGRTFCVFSRVMGGECEPLMEQVFVDMSFCWWGRGRQQSVSCKFAHESKAK